MVDTLIRLFESTETSFVTNGLGALPDAISCTVKEERNGEFELEMEYPITGLRYAELSLRCILVAMPNPYAAPQPFRIYSITKPINGIVTINAEHISYDMSGIPVSPFTAASISLAFTSMKEKAAIACPFTFWTDKTTTATMTVSVPTSMRALLGGTEGSILDVYGGGEYEFDGYEVKLHQNRGENRGVSIRYGKNLTDLEQEENCSTVYTGVYPYWASDSDGLVTLEEKIVPASGTYNFERILPLDLTDKFENAPTEGQLRTAAETYIANNDIGVPTVSLTVSFVQLAQSEEYAQYALLETVHLCDTVNVEFPELGVSATAKCISTTYDVLTDKYTELELGDPKTNLASTISTQSQSISTLPTKSFLDVAIDNATQRITGGLGGYVVMRSSTESGFPDEILIMDTDDIATATKVWRWNKNGLGYSGTGYNGPYSLAMTNDGKIVANMITAGEFDGAYIKAGSIDAETIRVGWNGYSKYLQLEDNGSLNIYNGSDYKLLTLNSNGMSYYYNGTMVGRTGTNSWANMPNYRGIVFDLENDGGFMCWSARDSASDSNYTVKMIYHHNNDVAQKGLHFSTVTYADYNLYLNSNCYFAAQNAATAVDIVGTLGVAYGGKRYITLDGVNRQFAVWNNALFDVYTDIDMHGYAINNQSDARLKTDIRDTEVRGLDVIRAIDLKSFDWIESGRHEAIGVIAQQLQQIAPELVTEDEQTGTLSVHESKLVYYCIKAIQELAEERGSKRSRKRWADPFTETEKRAFAKKQPSGSPRTDDKHVEPIRIPIDGGIQNGRHFDQHPQ